MNRAMPTHSTTPDETMARLDATLSKEEQQMLLEMIVGYQNGLGIEIGDGAAEAILPYFAAPDSSAPTRQGIKG